MEQEEFLKIIKGKEFIFTAHAQDQMKARNMSKAAFAEDLKGKPFVVREQDVKVPRRENSRHIIRSPVRIITPTSSLWMEKCAS